MIKNKTVLAIIPARAGSKGLPNKNKLDLNGKPLIEWSILHAKNSMYIDRIAVTSDDEIILRLAESSMVDYVIKRPDYLATDVSTTADVVAHLLEEIKNRFNATFDFIILLEPTSPLRKKKDIDQMLELLINKPEKDGVISVGKISLEHPSIMKVLKGDQVIDYLKSQNKVTRRQDLPDAYFPYGVGYIIKTNVFLKVKSFYTDNLSYYIIDRSQNYEIDDIYDFICVEAILQKLWKDL